MFSARLPVSSAGYTLLTARDAANQDITSQQPSMVTVAAHPAQMIHIIHIVWCYCVKLYCDLQSALLTVRVCQFSSNFWWTSEPPVSNGYKSVSWKQLFE